MTRPTFALRASAGRRGSTLIELLIFMVILALMAVSLLPLLFAATEDRLLQQTIAAVEQNGQQLLQTIEARVRAAERIIQPVAQSSGSILALQTGSGVTNPTIIGTISGALVLIEGSGKQTISSSQVAVQNFAVWNTAASAARGSVLVRFDLSRSIRLQAPRTYSRTFEGVFSLAPDDALAGDDCGCAVPGCAGPNRYVWQVCMGTQCLTTETQLRCP